MAFRDHLRTTGGALKNWAVAQFQDSLAVGVLWQAAPVRHRERQSAQRRNLGKRRVEERPTRWASSNRPFQESEY
jgi:hypothetical protein